MKLYALILRNALVSMTFGACATNLPSAHEKGLPAETAQGSQRIGVVSYISPAVDPAAWARFTSYPTEKISIFIANVMNGPGNSASSRWQDVIDSTSATEKIVLGYVRTGYLGLSSDAFTTRLGSVSPSDWVAQIEADIDLWYTLYPSIGGIFFDEVWNQCGRDNGHAKLYQRLSNDVKRKYPGATTVLNPGATIPQCFENSADVLMTFEGSYSTYTTDYLPNSWLPKNSTRIWHTIYDVPESEIGVVAALAVERSASILHVTDDILPNPYDTLPSDGYMQVLMSVVSGRSCVQVCDD